MDPARHSLPSMATPPRLLPVLAAGLISAVQEEPAPTNEPQPRAPSRKRRRKESARRQERAWKRAVPPVYVLGVRARDTLQAMGQSIGPKRRRRLMRAVARLEAFYKTRSSTEILQEIKDGGRRLVDRGLI